LKQCEAIAVCSQKGLSYFRDEGFPESNLYLVPLIPAWEPPLLVPSFSERPYHLLWAAQMNDSVKNVSFFVEVAIALKRRLPELKIHLVGRGPSERKTLARLRAAEIDHRHDRDIAWHEMPEVYASARVLVLPSLWEAWGMVCNEALQCGVPSVVSPFVGAADDVVLAGRNGEVCRLDVGEWVRKLERLVLDPEVWTSYSTNARADMRTRTLADVAASFRAMVDQVLGRAEKRRDRVKMHPPGSGEGPRIAAASCLALRIWVDEVVVSAAASECACAIF
jgi:glycosyltransferase involved in cell wall biosynthesis